MIDVIEDHLATLKASVLKRHTAASIAKWITEETTYAGQPYSFHNHEFQERIISDTSTDVVIKKCSQIGLSEVSARMALALVNVLRPYTVIYTQPTLHQAGTFTKTRVDPIIEGSRIMKKNVHPTTNNNELKQFGDSFIYIRGAASSNAPISIPADHLIHDEVDFSDQEVLGQYVSRLTHSQWKRTHKISTPTLPNFGIDRAMQETRRHYLFCKCNHCNFQFIPEYYKQVRIPGYTGDLLAINKTLLHKLRWQEAQLHCPSCGLVPSLQKEHREWVVENPDDNYDAAGYQVSPFDAPNIIKISSLIKASTSYGRIQDFVNFNLGQSADDNESTLTDADFDGVFLLAEAGSGTVNVMGVDVGNTYHFVISAVDAWGDMFTLHTEQVPMRDARRRYFELKKQYRVVCTVMDSMPHAETVMTLQEADINMFASVYMRSHSITTHTVVEKEPDSEKGKAFVRQVNVNRSRALDAYMEFIRGRHLQIKLSEEQSTIIAHHKSMKRVKLYDTDSGEMSFSWQKTDGIDHYHHAFLYCWLAGKIRGTSKNLIQLPAFELFSFKNKTM